MTNKKNSAQESLGATHSALEQLKCIPEKTEENGKTYVRGMLVDSILELDSRLRQLEKEKEFHAAVRMKRLEEAKCLSDLATNETSPTKEVFDRAFQQVADQAAKNMAYWGNTLQVAPDEPNEIELAERVQALEAQEKNRTDPALKQIADRLEALEEKQSGTCTPVVEDYSDARTIERTEGALHEVPLPDDTFDALVELLEFEDTSVETNWMTIKSTTFVRRAIEKPKTLRSVMDELFPGMTVSINHTSANQIDISIRAKKNGDDK